MLSDFGSLFMIVGILLILLGLFLSLRDVSPSKTRGAAVLLIGPVPIVWGSDWKIAVLLVSLTICLIVIWLLAFR